MADDDYIVDTYQMNTLYQLLSIRTPIGHLATAIEKHGIQGWDRYGRFQTFLPGTNEANRALGVLALQYEWESNIDNCQAHEQSPMDCYESGSGFDYGWLASSNVPDFPAIAAAAAGSPPAPARKQAQSNGRGEENALALVGVMLALLLGKTALGRKAFTSDAQLIGALADAEFAHVEGLSKGSLTTKLARAKELAWKEEWRDKK